ncbi:hypothetical protein BV22DRAFT_428109 [Leucogyrophana mollusca]|uniref:Uncharacterized protein n=1 Tax=Leucogyrophana mollusca TaxID=85980 RepID=A0ACB8BJ39_9AGAM|nr:hypothetical protein BV22DRAFT_428109 [Leucogyrophana mollusca]
MSHFEGLTRHLDARPLRLQPSPSLPNLRSAPRDRRPRQQPHPTPRKHSVQLPIATEDAHVKDHLSKEGVDGGVGQRHRDHTTRGNHHYLTPPLTPSSSLKSDSSGPDCAELYPDEEQPSCADDASSNRFLIIKNVPDDLLGPDIHQCINYLASISSADRADYGPSFPSPKSDNSPSLSIQTVYHRPNEIVIAFHDVRDANRVKCFIDAKGNTEAAEDQLRELLGPSACITKTEGQFCVSVDHVPSGTRDYSASPVTSWSRSRFSVPVKMKSILMKHGDFKPIQLLQDSACRQVGLLRRVLRRPQCTISLG